MRVWVRSQSMSIKTQLRIGIVTLVTLLVLAQCIVSLRIVAEDKFRDALDDATSIASQVQALVIQRVNEQTALARPQPRNVEETKALWRRLVKNDETLSGLLEKTMASGSGVIEILVCDDQGQILAASSKDMGHRANYLALPDFGQWKMRPVWERLFEVISERKDYSIMMPLGVPGQPILTIRVIVSSVLLRTAITPQVTSLAAVSTLSLLASIILAFLYSNVVLRSLERLSARIESIAAGKPEQDTQKGGREAKEFADMQSKLDLLSQQFRGAREDVHHLRNNIERMLERLEEGVLLFGPDGRLVRLSHSAERMLGANREQVLGKPLAEMFPEETPIGKLIATAVERRRAVRDMTVTLERAEMAPVRLLVNVELLESAPGDGRYSALITIRDVETRRQLRSQLDISTRLAAISRLTGGVAHEIKNPLNAIALHLELLRGRMHEHDLDQRELNVIASEIARLDRVVKTFLDFTRPVELKPRDVDLVELSRQVASLVWPQAERLGVMVRFDPGEASATIRGDEDLLKQAVLNVVNNGIEAMKSGGELQMRVNREGEEVVLSIADTGPGIPAEVRDKIFNLYFSTKQKGSGIGLAMTFRIVQLHNAAIDYQSEAGRGTTFRLRFPAVDEPEQGRTEQTEEPVETGEVRV